MAVAEGNGTIQVWDIATPQRPVSAVSIVGPAGPVQQVTFVSGGRTLAAAGWDHNVWVWNIFHPAHPARLAVLPAGANVASSVASSPDGSLLASGDWDGSVHVWDMAGHGPPTLLAAFNDRQRVRTIGFDPAGPFLAVGGDTVTGAGLHLWSITTGAKPRRIATIAASGPSVSALAFSPTAPFLAATGSYPGQTLLWNVADPARPAALPSLKGGSLSVAFSPDGKTLATPDQAVQSARAQDNEVDLGCLFDPENTAAAATVDVPGAIVGEAAVTPNRTAPGHRRDSGRVRTGNAAVGYR